MAKTSRKPGKRMSDAERAEIPDGKIVGRMRQLIATDFAGQDQMEWGRKKVQEHLATRGLEAPPEMVDFLAELVIAEKKASVAVIRTKLEPYLNEAEKRLHVKPQLQPLVLTPIQQEGKP